MPRFRISNKEKEMILGGRQKFFKKRKTAAKSFFKEIKKLPGVEDTTISSALDTIRFVYKDVEAELEWYELEKD